MWLLLGCRLRSRRRLSLVTPYRGWRAKRPLLGLGGGRRSLIPCLAMVARLRLRMLHRNRLLLRLHLVMLLSLLMGCCGHGSLMLRASGLLAHLLLLLEQVGWKIDERSLPHLSISHCL